MTKKHWCIHYIVLGAAILSLGGCDRHGAGPTSKSSSSRSGTSQMATKDPRLALLERETGITFPPCSQLLGEGEERSRDGGEYHEWLVGSPSNAVLQPAFGRETEHDDSTMPSTVRLINHRLDVAYHVPAEGRLAGSPAKASFASRDVPPYEYQVSKLLLDRGACYVLIMRHKR